MGEQHGNQEDSEGSRRLIKREYIPSPVESSDGRTGFASGGHADSRAGLVDVGGQTPRATLMMADQVTPELFTDPLRRA